MTSLAARCTDPTLVAWRDYYTLPVAVTIGTRLTLELPKKLESPNQVIWGHWRKLGRERKQWEALLWVALGGRAGTLARAALEASADRPRCGVPMTVLVVRYVASRRQYIRDEDNLVFAAKPLHDALTRVGLIYDDRRAWLRALPIDQRVSPDGRARTVVTLWPQETPDV